MPPATADRSASGSREHLLELLGPVVAAAGYDLEDLTVTVVGRRSVLRVIVDCDGGIDLDAVAQVSKLAAEVLDADSPGAAGFAGPYVLEVSSPGVDRPLTEPRHWRRAVGRLVRTTDGDTPVAGRVLDTSERGIRLDVAGAVRDVDWACLGPGKVQVEFRREGD